MGRPRAKTVECRIGYYRVDAGIDEAGNPVAFNLEPYLKHIDALPFDGVGTRRSFEDNGAVSCWIDRLALPYHIFLGMSHARGRSLTEKDGVRAPLALGPNRSLLQGIHAVLFFDDPYWIVGCEYNFFGPRITRLTSYLSQKSSCPNLSLLPLLRRDAERRLMSLQDVRLFSLRYHPSVVREEAKRKTRRSKAIDALDVIDEELEKGQVFEAEITLRSEAHSEDKLPRNLIEVMRKIFRNQSQYPEVVDAKIKGLSSLTGRVELVDILKAHITETVRVPRKVAADKPPESRDIYAAIERSYEKNREELLSATALAVTGEAVELDHSVA